MGPIKVYDQKVEDDFLETLRELTTRFEAFLGRNDRKVSAQERDAIYSALHNALLPYVPSKGIVG
jgi:hypothetical protein